MSKTSNFITIFLVFSVIIITVPSYGLELNFSGGNIVVALTPFDKNGKLNRTVVPQIAKYYAEHNITNVLIAELNGDGTLPLRERKDLVAAWVEQGCLLGLNIIVEIGLQPFVDKLSLARFCNEQNVAAITHFPELVYQADNVGETIEDLKKISEAAPNISLIYNELLLANSDVSADAVYLAGDEVPTFCGVETTLNTYWDIEAVTSTCTSNNSSKCNKEVWIFDVHYMYPAFLFGLRSVSIGPNIAPSLCLEIEAAAKRCDRKTGKALQKKLNSWVAAFGNLNGGVIDDEDFRTFFANLRAAFEIITGIKVGTRDPIDTANPIVYDKIASNLRSVGAPVLYSGSGSQ